MGLWQGSPVAPGHALLVTRRHVASWFDASPEERSELAEGTHAARVALQELGPSDGFNIGVDVGAAGGQSVPHLHVHVIPRRAGELLVPQGGARPARPSRRDGPSAGSQLLTTGPSRPLWPELKRDIDAATSLDLAVAFIMSSGVARIAPQLEDLLARGGQLRVLTGDYLDVTDPRALKRLMDWQSEFSSQSVQLRVFETFQAISFHPKTFICRGQQTGVAYVGSSNLSRSALESGVEWNYRVLTSREAEGFSEALGAFEDLFAHPSTRPLTEEWVDQYEARRVRSARPIPEVDTALELPPPPPEPSEIQKAALAALATTRQRGNRAGLVVLATGLGKTWLSAFDAEAGGFARVLFVAHREEILAQATETFRRLRPLAAFGRYDGEFKDTEAEVLFASIQTLGRVAHLERFSKNAFDYVVIDEFHHASAKTYQRLIAHFTPKFLLGLTATPERSDGGDLLRLCGENLVYRCDLVEGVRAKLLCPFHYFGVPDSIDYTNIPWRSGRFDEETLTQAASTQARAENALDQWRQRAQTRTLAFCVSQRHADFMEEYFRTRGVRCAAVHSGPGSAPRASTLEALTKGELQVVFAVDMFNEGVDVPDIDTVLMLRPTESPVLFLQQLGRGLRRKDGKERLVVIDYIGNHRSFLLKPRTLLQLKAGDDRELSLALQRLAAGELELPPGCEVTYELAALDLIQGLLRIPKTEDALRSYYEDFRERRGTRPTASEALHDGYLPHTARRSYGSWLGLVEAMGDLNPLQRRARSSLEDFLNVLEVTPMAKSYKILVLEGMLNADALPGELGVEALTHRVRELAERNETLRADVGVALRSDKELRSMLLRNPIDDWTGGGARSEGPYFQYDSVADQLRFLPPVPAEARTAAQELIRELVDLRMAQYLNRELITQTPADGFQARVSHASGRPILSLPDRSNAPIPEGWTQVTIGEEQFDANFAQVALNVLRRPGSEQNELPTVLRGWFGPNAGLPGTNFMVVCEPQGEGYSIRPMQDPVSEAVQLWRPYSREQIPPLFGATFSDAIWNVGFVTLPQRLVLMLTLEKKHLAENFRYADHFLSRELFEMQSQNRHTQKSKAGEAMRNHQALGISVELFVRKTKKVGSAAAPFIYCGPVAFEEWHGEKPITVKWRLSKPVPDRLWEILKPLNPA